jgi:hypothetical protein
MLIWEDGRRVGIRMLHPRIMGLNDDHKRSGVGREELLGGGGRGVGRELFYDLYYRRPVDTERQQCSTRQWAGTNE